MRKKHMKKIGVGCLLIILILAFSSVAFASYYCDFSEFPLKKEGAKDNYVRAIQTVIKYNLNSALSNDGIFGSGTTGAVVDFQKKNGLTSDGKVGTKTWCKLDDKLSYTYTGSTDGGRYRYDCKIKRSNGTVTNTTFFQCVSTNFGATGTWYVYKAAAGDAAGTWYTVGTG